MATSVRKLAAILGIIGAFSFISGQAQAQQSTWNGGGINNNFSNAQNWVGNVAPVPNDIIVFDGAIRPTPNNDYPTGTVFNGITFASTVAGPFVVTGNQIGLNGDINDNTQAFLNTLSLPIALQITPNVSVTSTGSLTITSVISGTGFGLNENGSGLLTLSGTNTFTGPIVINGGVLAVGTTATAPDANLGGSASLTINNGATLLVGIRSSANSTLNNTLSATRPISIGPSSGAGTAFISVLNNTNTNGSLAAQQNVTYNGVISNNGSGIGSLTKIGFGTLILGGPNAYTGNTTIGTGNLQLDFTQATAPVSNIINSSSPLVMGGFNAGQGAINYATLISTGSTTNNNSQTFNGTTINVGNAIIQAASGTGRTNTVNLGAITDVAGGTVVFIPPASGSITTTTPNTNGILGGWATFGANTSSPNVQTLNGVTVTQGNTFAANDGTGKIVAYTGYTKFTSSVTLSGTTAASNVQVSSGASPIVVTTGTGLVDINTMSFISNQTGSGAFIGAGNTLRLGKYGALMNQDTNTNNHVIFIGGTSSTPQTGSGSTGTQDVGTLTAGGADNTPGQIVFNIGNSSFTAGSYIIESKITDNGTGAVSVVKTGAGSMKLDGHNTFTGGLTIASGRLQFAGSEIGTANPTGGGTGTITILPGGQLFPSGAAGAGVVITNPFSIAGFGVASELDGAMRLSNNTLSGTITLIGDAQLGSGGTNNVFLTGQITGGFNLSIGASQTISGTVNLGNANLATPNNWTGNTILQMRTNGNGNNGLILGADEQIPNGVGFGNVIMVGESTAGGTSTYVWNMNGHNETINGLQTGGGTGQGVSITNNGAAPSLLTLGDNNQTASFSGNITDGSSTIAITKIGTGLQTLAGANSYSGVTNINNGALSVSGSLNTGGAVNVNTSATAGSALYGGNATGTPSTVGVLALQAANGSHKAVINPGPAGPGTTGIINAASVSIGAGSDLQFDLFSSANAGFNFDQLTSNGPIALNGATTITAQPFGPGLYPIIMGTAAGATPAISGTLPTIVAGVTRLTVAYDASSWNPTTNASATSIVLNATGSVGNLTWTGATNSTWDIVGTPNWTSNAPTNPNLFFQADNVAFTDAGANKSISLGQVVSPSSMTVTNSTGNDYSFTGGGSIAGPGGLTKSGAGNLSLNTSNAFVGAVTLNGGQLNINNNSALGFGNSLIINGGSLGNTSGSPVAVANNPAQTWAVDVTFNGTSDLDLGTGAVNATETPGNPRTFNIVSNTLTVGGKITENTPNTGITKIGTGTLALNGNSTFAGAAQINAGTVRVGTSASLGGALVINATPAGNTIVVPSTTGLTVGIGVSGVSIPVGTVITAIDTGTNTVTLSAAATAGNAVDLTFATNTTAITVASGAALDVGGPAAANSIVIGPRAVTISGTGVGSTGALTNSSTTNQQNAFQSVTLAANASVGGTGRFDIRGGTPTLNLAGFTLTKVGTGQFSVVDAPISAGNIAVSAGTLSIEAAANVLNDGSDSITVNATANSSTLQFFQNTGTISRPITINQSGSNTLTINDASGAAGLPFTVASNITMNGNLTLNDANAANVMILSGTLTETGGSRTLTKNGPGIISLANTANAFSGAITVNAGLLNFAALGSLGTGTSITFNGGGLQYALAMASPPDLSARTLTFSANGATIDTNGNNVTFANKIGGATTAGAGGFTKAGDGILTLNGQANYTGTTTVSQGTLFLGAANSFPTSGGLAIGAGTLDLNGASLTVSSLNSVGATPTTGQIGSSTGTNITLTYAGAAASTSTYTGQLVDGLNGNATGKSTALTVSTGTLVLAGTITYSGATTINSGATLQLGNAAASPTLGTTTITNNGTLVFGAPSLTVANSISGTGAVTQNATAANSVTTLSSSNTYTGLTTLQAGTLSISSDAAVNNGVGGITFTGGTLELNNYTSNLPFSSTSGNVSIGSQGTATLNSPITTTGSFTSAGSGTLVLNGASTYAGNTTVSSGTLQLGGSNKLPSTTNLTLVAPGGATFNTGGFSQTLGKLNVTGANATGNVDLGNGSSILHFANSSLPAWGSSLAIANWSGSGAGGGIDQIFFGNNSYSGLSRAQLNSINFSGAATAGAILLSTGELVPNPTGVALALPVLGDFDGNGTVQLADIPTMLTALTDLNAYQISHQLSDADLLAVADVNHSGTITNADIQAELDLAASLGLGSVGAVPEPASWLLLSVGGLTLLGLRSRKFRTRKAA